MASKTLYIIRGVPGSGKTTLARQLAGNNIVAADDYFMQVGSDGKPEYKYRQEDIGVAHRHCQYRIATLMERGVEPLAVHNTFIKQWEWQPYIEMCKTYGYSPFVVTCSTVFGNSHDVPDEIVVRMKNDFEYETLDWDCGHTANLDPDTAGNDEPCAAISAMTARMKLVTED